MRASGWTYPSNRQKLSGMRLILTSLVALPLLFPALPAQAQRSERVLVIFGNDPCPTNASGDEIIVCARRPESERYRIPQQIAPRLTKSTK